MLMGRIIKDIPEYDGIGVYSLIDGHSRRYVGVACNVKKRILQHDAAMYHNKASEKLQAAADAGAVFAVEILEKIPYGVNKYYLNERESFWVNKLDAVKSGYNTQPCRIISLERDMEDLKRWVGSKSSYDMARYMSQLIEKKSKPILKPTTNPQTKTHDGDYMLKTIPRFLHDRIKARAAELGKPVNRYIVDLIRQDMDANAGK